MKKKILLLITLFTFMLTIFTGCSSNVSSTSIAPFANITWESTLDSICEYEANEYESSLSMSGGYNYIFPKQYLGFDGCVQYNLDDAGKLVGVSWFYIGNDQKTANDIYTAIYKDTTNNLGNQDSLDDSNIYTGNRWETDDSNVLLISFSQNNEYAVQISYLLKDTDAN